MERGTQGQVISDLLQHMTWRWAFILILASLAVIVWLAPADAPPAKLKPPVEVVENSHWDGSVQQVKTWLEKHANDADSLQYVEWSPVQKDPNGYLVRCKFRAKNASGAYVLNENVFRLDAKGNVLGPVPW